MCIVCAMGRGGVGGRVSGEGYRCGGGGVSAAVVGWVGRVCLGFGLMDRFVLWWLVFFVSFLGGVSADGVGLGWLMVRSLYRCGFCRGEWGDPGLFAFVVWG